MITFSKAALILCVVVILVIVIAYWWSNTVPGQPPNVAANAVWLWASHGPLPGARYGYWANCFVDASATPRCQVWNESGRDLFDGVVTPYPPTSFAPSRSLVLNTSKAGRVYVTVKGESVPVVDLQGGPSLIPADAYAQAMRVLRPQ